MVSKKYKPINSKPTDIGRYYCFDIDDNLVKTNTKITLETLVNGNWVPHEVTSAEFSIIRSDNINYRYSPESFLEFSDSGPRGNKAFMEDFINAIISNKFAPSWNTFIKCIINGNLFALITARGHYGDTLRSGVKWVIYNYLSSSQFNTMIRNLKLYDKIFNGKSLYKTSDELIEQYLNNCDFYGVSSPEFISLVPDGMCSPENGKQVAIEMFANKVHAYSKKIKSIGKLGFSDDDSKNIEHIEKFMKDDLSLKYPLSMSVFDTSKGECSKRKI